MLLEGSNLGSEQVEPNKKAPSLSALPDFSLTGPVNFEPTYYPERVKPSKKRELDREAGLCNGEQVTDTGSKNKDIHVSGYILESEKSTFWDLLDSGEELKMIAMPWSGHVYVKDGDLEGPLGIDNQQGEWVYEYTMTVVESMSEDHQQSGVVRDGDS